MAIQAMVNKFKQQKDLDTLITTETISKALIVARSGNVDCTKNEVLN